MNRPLLATVDPVDGMLYVIYEDSSTGVPAAREVTATGRLEVGTLEVGTGGTGGVSGARYHRGSSSLLAAAAHA